MALIRRPRDGALLVSEYTDPALAPIHRPLGGHVEFGEYALDTVHREFLEEIGQNLTEVRLLGVHEIVFMFAGALADPAAYEIPEQYILDEVESPTRVIWRPPGAAGPPLYPAGAELLLATRPA